MDLNVCLCSKTFELFKQNLSVKRGFSHCGELDRLEKTTCLIAAITLGRLIQSSRSARLIPYIDTLQLHLRRERFSRFWALIDQSVTVRTPAPSPSRVSGRPRNLGQPIFPNSEGLLQSRNGWKWRLSQGQPAILKMIAPGAAASASLSTSGPAIAAKMCLCSIQ